MKETFACQLHCMLLYMFKQPGSFIRGLLSSQQDIILVNKYIFSTQEILVTIYKYLYFLMCDISFKLLYTLSLSTTEITDFSN